MSSHEDLQGRLDLIELARDKSKDTLAFLEAVRDNRWQQLGLEKSVPVALRLQAAEILRKFAALPSQVDLNVGARVELVYEGDEGVRPAE